MQVVWQTHVVIPEKLDKLVRGVGLTGKAINDNMLFAYSGKDRIVCDVRVGVEFHIEEL